MTKSLPMLKDVVLVALIGVFIGYLAPFGMHTLPVYVSTFYWAVVCVLGYGIYKPIIVFARQRLLRNFDSEWPKVAIACLFASIIMSVALPVITWLFFRGTLELTNQFLQVLPKTIVIGGVITLSNMARERLRQQKAKIAAVELAHGALEQKLNADKSAGCDKLMAMLPIEKRGKLLYLQMDDHYLKVQTDKGQHLLLMRFKDAIELLQHYPGVQTHRSWWVALDAVATSNKLGRKHSLLMTNDVEIPISQTYLAQVKALGLV